MNLKSKVLNPEDLENGTMLKEAIITFENERNEDHFHLQAFKNGLHPSVHLPDKRVKFVFLPMDHSLHLSSVFTRTPAGLLVKEIADVPGKLLGSPAM